MCCDLVDLLCLFGCIEPVKLVIDIDKCRRRGQFYTNHKKPSNKVKRKHREGSLAASNGNVHRVKNKESLNSLGPSGINLDYGPNQHENTNTGQPSHLNTENSSAKGELTIESFDSFGFKSIQPNRPPLEESERIAKRQLLGHGQLVRTKKAKYLKRHLVSSEAVKKEMTERPTQAFKTLIADSNAIERRQKNASSLRKQKSARHLSTQSSPSLAQVE